MKWRPDPNDKASWSTVGSGLVVVGLGGVANWHNAIAPACGFGSVGLIGLYTAFMPLVSLPPWPRDRAANQDQSLGEPEAQPVEEVFASTPENALLEATEKSDEFRDLKFHLREGRRLGGRLDSGQTREVENDEDHVYNWALETWIDLDHHRPILAKQFFGDKHPYGQMYFAITYSIEVDRVGRRGYLEDRLAILRHAVKAPE